MTLVKEGALIRPFSAAFSLGGCPYRRRPQKKPPGPRARIPDTDFSATRVPQRTRVASADDWRRVYVRHGIHRLVGLGHLMESMPANWFQESCVVFVVVCCVWFVLLMLLALCLLCLLLYVVCVWAVCVLKKWLGRVGHNFFEAHPLCPTTKGSLILLLRGN